MRLYCRFPYYSVKCKKAVVCLILRQLLLIRLFERVCYSSGFLRRSLSSISRPCLQSDAICAPCTWRIRRWIGHLSISWAVSEEHSCCMGRQYIRREHTHRWKGRGSWKAGGTYTVSSKSHLPIYQLSQVHRSTQEGRSCCRQILRRPSRTCSSNPSHPELGLSRTWMGRAFDSFEVSSSALETHLVHWSPLESSIPQNSSQLSLLESMVLERPIHPLSSYLWPR